MRWAAMLRGINLGKRQLKSAELKAAVEELGFTDVKTLLASGNVVFTADDADAAALEAKLHDALFRATGLRSEIFVRSPEEMAAVAAADPFPEATRERPSFVVVTSLVNAAPTATTQFAIGVTSPVQARPPQGTLPRAGRSCCRTTSSTTTVPHAPRPGQDAGC